MNRSDSRLFVCELLAEDPLCIEPGSFTLPEMLRQNGYRTSIVGKWHLGDALVGDLPTGLSHPELLRYGADVQHSGTIVNGVSRIGHMAGGSLQHADLV